MAEATDAVAAELAARIAFGEGTIATWADAASTRPRSIEATARTHTGGAWFDIGVCRLLLGDLPQAAGAFVASAGALRSALEVAPPSPLATQTAAIEAAVLAGDRALAADIARAHLEPEPTPSLVADRLAWARALPALVRGDDEEARTHAEEAAARAASKAWYPGIGDALAALLRGDGSGLATAFELVLAKHTRYARAKKSWCYNSGPCLVCVPASVLMRLAAWRGLVVRDVTNRRSRVPLALVHSNPGAALDIEVDFLAS